MPWEHRSEPLAPKHIFVGRMLRQIFLVVGMVTVALVLGTLGFMIVSRGSEDLGPVNAFLESSMLLSGAGPLYTERTSTAELKIFSSLYALFSTLVIVSSVGILASPIVHRAVHQLHLERERKG